MIFFRKFSIIVYTFLGLIYQISLFAQSALYDGEKLVEVNKVQTLYKFIESTENSSDKPLIIFVPGDAHLARISYGFPDGKEDDFLAYWFHKKGFPFLGVSYPSDNYVFSKVYPEFSVRDWGNQIALLTKQLLVENKLTNHVVVLAWDMAGNVEESIQEAFDKNKINCDGLITLSAVPPLPYLKIIDQYSSNKILPNHLADRKQSIIKFSKFLEEQNKYNFHEIIPQNIYLKEFIGNVPVSILGEGYYFLKNKFEFNPEKVIQDLGIYNFSHTPLIGVLVDDSPSNTKVTTIDTAAWNFIRSEMLFRQYIYYINVETNNEKFSISKRILSQIPQYFYDNIHGNSMFFVGKKGARETEQKVEILIQKMNTTKQNLVKLALE
jgi:hypothetical protein